MQHDVYSKSGGKWMRWVPENNREGEVYRYNYIHTDAINYEQDSLAVSRKQDIQSTRDLQLVQESSKTMTKRAMFDILFNAHI